MKTKASQPAKSIPSPQLAEFEFLYGRLQEFKEAGAGDDFQADGLRLRLDYLFDEMDEDDRVIVREKTGPLMEPEDDYEYDDSQFAAGDDDVDADDEFVDESDVEIDEEEVEEAEKVEEVKVEEVKAKAPREVQKPREEKDKAKKEPVKAKKEEVAKDEVKAAIAEVADVEAEEVVETVAVAKVADEVEPTLPQPLPKREGSKKVATAKDESPASATASAPAAAAAPASAAATYTPLPKPAEVFDRSVTFATLGLHPDLLKGINAMGFEYPTDIQAKLIPPALRGIDLIGQARTGTGKTAAFGMPIIHQADAHTPMQALILVPTRELAAQVAGELEDIGKFTPIRASCIIGGESMRDQAKSISKGGHMMVGTPGRVMDMQQRGEIHFHNIRFIVLDEVDRMLDIGFREDIRKILKSVQTDHQTIFVSATISDEIERLARSFMKPNAEKILTISGSLTVSLVDQKYVSVEPWDKRAMLLHILRKEKPESTVVFCRTKATVDKLSKYLADHGIDARPIHGDMPQNKRVKVMDSMRQKKLDVLIASDLAARGLDIDHITHVVNYDLPEDPEVYVHRIGRTARAGRRGFAWSFVTRDEGQRLTEIEMLCSTMIERLEYPEFKPGPVPEDIRLGQPRPRITERATNAVELMAAKAAQRTVPSAVDGLTEDQIKAMFPDGNIPKTLPKSTLGSRFKRKR